MRQRRIFVAALILTAVLFVQWRLHNIGGQPAVAENSQAAEQLLVSFLDVGQGDAILIKAPNGRRALIDGGEDVERLLSRLSSQTGWFEQSIDWLILTHPHSDHLKGLNGLFDRFAIKAVMATLVNHNSSIYHFWLSKLREKNIPITTPAWPQEFLLGDDVKLSILHPSTVIAEQSVGNLNNSSLVILLSYGQTRFLLMGDAEIAVEQELLERGLDIRAQVLKIGHHGSSTATSQEFLAAVAPQAAVISVGVDNDFGHPHQRVLNRLGRFGATILRTDQLGTVNFASDGKVVWLLE